MSGKNKNTASEHPPAQAGGSTPALPPTGEVATQERGHRVGNTIRAWFTSRSWLQYSLRSLFVLTTIVAIFFAWLGYRYREAQRARAIVSEMGGSVSIWNYWDHRWGQVTTVNLSQTEINDRALARIASEVPGVRVLLVEGTRITDDGLVHLQKLHNLDVLFFSDTQISDRGLEHLQRLPNLTFLQAHRTSITDAGVAELKGALPDLEVYYTAQ